jgi:signal transduction histidine kinase
MKIMAESYSGQSSRGVVMAGTNPFAVAEPSSSLTTARDLIAQLLPGVDADRLVRALVAEHEPGAARHPEPARYDSDSEISARELQRVRAQFALGESARTLQHAFNNPLTALLAETQLLALEPLPPEHRAAVGRILELCRRLAALSRRLSGGDAARQGG